MKASILKKFNQKKINQLIQSRELENLDQIKKIEELLLKERGYVIKIPKEKTPVILLFSGGLDTTIMAQLLLEKFNLTIYPVFIRRGHSFEKAEEKATDFFTKYFQKKYPSQFKTPIKLTAYFPPKEIKSDYLKAKDTPFKKDSQQLWDDFFFSTFHILYAAQYAYTLQTSQDIKIRSIFTGFMKCDGERKIDHTLTSLRSIMLSLCTITQDFEWQATSLALEKELGFFYDKDYFISWAAKQNLPLHKTRSSCLNQSRLHCGECMVCHLRKSMFKKAGIKDKTKYANRVTVQSHFHELKTSFKKILSRLKSN